MGVRAARLTDFLSVRALAHGDSEQVLLPAAGSDCLSPGMLTLLSVWHALGHRFQTVILKGDERGVGFAQAVARSDRESWDIVRLACFGVDAEQLAPACTDLLEWICIATAQWGALRTFTRVHSDSEALPVLESFGFRSYAAETTYIGNAADLMQSGRVPGEDIRVRFERDAWDIFSLYCAITPALVRHAEGRSLREWLRGGKETRSLFPSRGFRELVMGEQGDLQGWLRVTPTRGHHHQMVEILMLPDAAHRLPEMLIFAVQALGLRLNLPMICRTREYDGRLSATLEASGHKPLYRETLLVRHTVARVTERQLLIAALRAQGLGIDLSQYRRSLEPVHQRLASTRGAETHSYDRNGRICFGG